MKLSDFDYSFPPELVALYPARERDASRMMVLHRATEHIEHKQFRDFADYFEPGDVLVLNNSKVFPCRLLTTCKGGGRLEVLLLREIELKLWECLLSPSKKIDSGTEIIFSDELAGQVVGDFDETRKIRLIYSGELQPLLHKIGHVPLPPYIKRADLPEIDRDRYQTVYADPTGSAAAPTAGFHFTRRVLDTLKEKGVQVVSVTLHVGIGTFLPIRVEAVKNHRMHGEHYEIPTQVAEIVNKTKSNGGRISVVGTTAVRALESAWEKEKISPGPGYTEKFIYPPYSFRVVDRLLTNFHQPQSTLLVLVSAFAGREVVLRAYQEAIRARYRLFSYGDCMWVV